MPLIRLEDRNSGGSAARLLDVNRDRIKCAEQPWCGYPSNSAYQHGTTAESEPPNNLRLGTILGRLEDLNVAPRFPDSLYLPAIVVAPPDCRRAPTDGSAHGHILRRMSNTIKAHDSFAMLPGWQTVFLVCKDCRRRKNGPKNVKPKELAKEIKHQVKDTEPKARIVLTTCLKLCAKKATSVAVVGIGIGPRIAAVKSKKRFKKDLATIIDNMKD